MSQIPQCQSLNIYDVNKQGPKKYVFVPHVFKRHQNIYIYISFLLMFFVVGHKQQVTFGHDFKRKNANLPLPWESHSKTMYSVVMQKNVCDFPNFKGESPPHPRTIAPTSWDPNTAEPTLAPWPWSSCHGDGRENGVSAPLSPSHRCRRHSSPWSTNPLKGTGRPWNPHGLKTLGVGVLWIHPFEFGGEIWKFWKYQQECMVYLPTVASSFMVHVCKNVGKYLYHMGYGSQ